MEQRQGKESGSRKRFKRTAAAVAFVVFGTMFAVVSQPAKAAPGDLRYQACYSDKLLPGATCLFGGRAENPSHVVVSPDGNFLYASTTATASGIGRITTFRIATDGSLTDIGCIGEAPICTPPGPVPMGLVYGAAVSPDGRFLYMADAGLDRILVFVRNVVTGELTYGSCVRDASQNTDGKCVSVPFLNDPADLAIEDFTRTLYVASLNSPGGVVWFDRASDGTLAFRGCMLGARRGNCLVANGVEGGASAVAADNNGKAVYVASRGNLVTFSREGTSLRSVGCYGSKKSAADPVSGADGCEKIPGLAGVSDIVISADRASVYVASAESDAVIHFQRSLNSGVLAMRDCFRDLRKPATGCTGADHLRGASSVAVSQDLSLDSTAVYVTSFEGSLIPFDADTTNGGKLAQHGCITDNSIPNPGCGRAEGLAGAVGVVVRPGDRDIYVVGRTDSAVAQLRREGSVCQSNPAACAFPGPGGDTAAPETTVGSAPKPKTRKSDAIFAFSSSEQGSTFECSFDGDDFDACTSPHTVTGIAKGRHFFQVVAIDAAGNRDQSPARVDFKVKAKRR